MKNHIHITKVLLGIACFALYAVQPMALVYARGTSEEARQPDSQKDPQASDTETRTVTDHAGNVVEIPVNPQRVASLSAGLVTIPLLELDAAIVGSATSTRDGKTFIFSAKELFDLDFESSNLFDYGSGGKDIEQVKASQPDLIIGSVRGKYYDVVSGIAPTVLVDFGKGREMYEDIAMWIGKEKRYNELYTQYKTRLKEVKAKFTIPPEKQTIAITGSPNTAKGTISLYNTFGSIPAVVNDLGFNPTSFVRDNLQGELFRSVNLEILDDIFTEADFFILPIMYSYGETEEEIHSSLDEIMPKWRQAMKAYKNDNFIIMQEELGLSHVFKCYNFILDVFEKHAQ